MVRSQSRLDCTTRQMKSSVSKPVLNHAWQLKMNTFGRPLDKQNGRLFLFLFCLRRNSSTNWPTVLWRRGTVILFVVAALFALLFMKLRVMVADDCCRCLVNWFRGNPDTTANVQRRVFLFVFWFVVSCANNK